MPPQRIAQIDLGPANGAIDLGPVDLGPVGQPPGFEAVWPPSPPTLSPAGPSPTTHAQWGEQNPWAMFMSPDERQAREIRLAVPQTGYTGADRPNYVNVPEVPSVATRRQEFDPEGYQAFEDWRAVGQEGMPPLSRELVPQASMLGRFAADRLSLGLVDEFMLDPEARRVQQEAVQGFLEIHPEAAGLGFALDMVPAGLLGWLSTLPKSAAARLATGFASAGTEGTLMQIGHGDPSLPALERVSPLLSTISAVTGLAVPTSSGAARRILGVDAAPDPSQIRETYRTAAQALYREFDNAGIYLNDVVYETGINSALIRANGIRGATIYGPDGVRPLPVSQGGFASVNRIVSTMDGYRGQAVSMADIEGIQQQIAEAIRNSTNGSEITSLGALREGLDDFVETIAVEDLYQNAVQTMGPEQARAMVDEARALYRVSAVMSVLEEAERRATLASPRGAYDTALAAQMRRVANNPKLSRLFDEEQLAIIERIAGGDKSAKGRLANLLGWMAPRGWAVTIPVTAAVTTGNIAPLIPMGIGTIARNYQSRATQDAFDRLVTTIVASAPQLGGTVPMLPARAWEQAVQTQVINAIGQYTRGPTIPEQQQEPPPTLTPTNPRF